MLHYNFPPFCVGETGFMSGAEAPRDRSRQTGSPRHPGGAAGHGEFPYVIRVVSEITESNGSSSMASVCGTSLALMDAGVPIKAPVAGIAMGLIKEGDRYQVLTDILGDEDHLGDMDFKVAGTEAASLRCRWTSRSTASPPRSWMRRWSRPRDGRLHILGEMNKVMPARARRCPNGRRPSCSP
jgi:polyribonucleotide nucleotidyltransferase